MKYLLSLLIFFSQFARAQVMSCGPAIANLRISSVSKSISTSNPHVFTSEKSKDFFVTVSTVRDGLWSDPGTWGGLVPLQTDNVQINHAVTLDISTTIAGANISGALIYALGKTATLQSTKNVIVTGLLQARPANPSIIHTLRFIGVKEDAFIGGGEDPMDSDVGLWVMGAGKLDLQGSAKTSWAWSNTGIAGTNINITQKGWNVGDELMITPTAKGATVHDERTITAINGEAVVVNASVTRATVNGKWNPEVCNLTRNVRIEGTAAGKSHVFVRSTVPQNIQYVQFRYLGPRKNQAGDAAKEFILGRYGFHDHHCGEGSRGTIIEGCVMRDIDNHSYVTHGSNGILVHNNIAYNVTETPFWWDEGFQHASHDISWIHNVAALVKFVPRSINVENKDGDVTLSSRGYLLGHGDGNICDSCVAVGCQGDPRDGAGFKWEAVSNEYLEGVWGFRFNRAHNNQTGEETWQNVQQPHVISYFVSYHNGIGIYHGAYANPYKMEHVELYGNQLIIHAASSNESRIRFEDFTIDAGGADYAVVIEGNTEPGAVPILIRDLKATNYKLAVLSDQAGREKVCADIIQSDGKFVMAAGVNAAEVLRIQPISGQTIQITPSGTKNITAFAPTLWGTGNGLKGEYFNNPDFTSPAFTRTDPYIGYSEWENKSPHHLIKYTTYSVRWSGKIQPQFSENYSFNSTGKLFIAGKQITGPIALKAGELYDIRIDYSKSTSIKEGVTFRWTSPSLKNWTEPWEYVPQSQLYSDAKIDPPPANKSPVTNAGQDITIQLPVNSVTLIGNGSDPEGSALSYKWTYKAGQLADVPITNSTSPAASVSGLVAGGYIFTLAVTDDKGATASDDVNVTVKPEPPKPNQPPVVAVGVTVTVTKSGTILLTGSATDPEGGQLTYEWRQSAGTKVQILSDADIKGNATIIGAPEGNYKFILKVTDDKGLFVEKEVSVTI
ncbi:MAG TPA: PA14 domain-containing protein [Chitinophagaceae bacterium]|nr:PA14 domain-containing protein [Chitinophagaceae bacterium]